MEGVYDFSVQSFQKIVRRELAKRKETAQEVNNFTPSEQAEQTQDNTGWSDVLLGWNRSVLALYFKCPVYSRPFLLWPPSF